jgi:hypothetical protein
MALDDIWLDQAGHPGQKRVKSSSHCTREREGSFANDCMAFCGWIKVACLL